MKFGNGSNVSGLGGGKVGKKLRRPMSMPPGGPTPPPAEPTDPSAAMITFASDWQALAEPTHAGMAQDEPHQREMVLMTGVLATRAGCTHVAVQDGNWTDATTWLVVATDLFGLPGAGHKLGIPAGITVTMNNNTTAAYDTLRVDGSVVYPINQDTKLYCDTIVVNHGGVWQQGTELDPIPAAYTSEIVHPDNGNIDTTLVTGDFLLLGRGFLGMGATLMAPSSGSITICGADKTKWAVTDQARSVGATTIIVDSLPSDWAIGNELYIAGTKPRPDTNSASDFHQYDVVEITGINAGTREITFTPALQFARSVPTLTGFPEASKKYHVCNLTRNVRFYSPDGTAVHHRGHLMVMGENIYVRAAEFRNLGRTRKNGYTGGEPAPTADPSVDATNDAARITINGGDTAWAANANVRGRYNLHVHRSGIATGQDYAQFINCVAHIAPGWGIAHHQSNCDITDCISVVFAGAGFMAEVGSEEGSWNGNFAGGSTQPLWGEGNAQKRAGSFNGDFGRFGDGFWFKGRVVELDGNIAANCNMGYSWMSRFPEFSAGERSNVQTSPEPRIFYGIGAIEGTVDSDRPVIHNFKNNGGYGLFFGSSVIKANPNQMHGYRSNFWNTFFWNINRDGMNFEYTGHYTIVNTYVHKDPATAVRWRGVAVGGNSGDFFVENVVARGTFQTGVLLAHLPNTGTFPTGDHRHWVVTDSVTVDAGINATAIGTNNNGITVAALASLTDASYTPATEPVFPNGSGSGTQWYMFDGNITRETGTDARWHEQVVQPEGGGIRSQFTAAALNQMLIRDGYYTYTHPTHGASRYVLVPDLIALKRLDVNGDSQRTYLTLVMRMDPTYAGLNFNNYTNNGALASKYTDVITTATYVVYEDILA